MRKVLTLTVLVMVVVYLVTLIGFAESEIQISIDGKFIKFTDALPFIDENGRTLVPIRILSESMGYKVTYRSTPKLSIVFIEEVYKDIYNKSISIHIGKRELYSDKVIWMDTIARIVNNRTYIPIRAVAEAFNKDVNWNSPNRTITITTSELSPIQTPLPTPLPKITNKTDNGYTLPTGKYRDNGTSRDYFFDSLATCSIIDNSNYEEADFSLSIAEHIDKIAQIKDISNILKSKWGEDPSIDNALKYAQTQTLENNQLDKIFELKSGKKIRVWSGIGLSNIIVLK
jgi:hypothetical protein